MIPAACLDPPCPVLSTCKAKYRPLPKNARPGTCYARPAPFLPIWIPVNQTGGSGGNHFAVMARQERELRRAATEGCSDSQY